jgi:CoA binding protein
VTNAAEILATSESVLVVDWPSRDVPDTLADAGFDVYVRSGPGPDDYSPKRPERVDLVYCYRPLDELPGIVELARGLGAKAVWHQSGRTSDGTADPAGCWLPDATAQEARSVVEAAGLRFVHDVYIADAAQQFAD